MKLNRERDAKTTKSQKILQKYAEMFKGGKVIPNYRKF